MTDDETMWRCIGALLLEGDTFTAPHGRQIIEDQGGNPNHVEEKGYAERVGVIRGFGIYRVTEKGRQFFLADHSKKED